MIIAPEKLRDYVLSPAHPVGRFKAAYFLQVYLEADEEGLHSGVAGASSGVEAVGPEPAAALASFSIEPPNRFALVLHLGGVDAKQPHALASIEHNRVSVNCAGYSPTPSSLRRYRSYP